MEGMWGNPGTETYRQKYIREARAAGGTAQVRQEIVAVAARLLEGLSDLHIEIPEKVASYDPEGTEGQRIGIAIHLLIPLPPAPEVIDLATQWGFDGFAVDGTDLIELRYMQSKAVAAELTDAAIAGKLDQLVEEPVSGPVLERWPGLRDLEDGDTGADVEFLRLVLGVGREEPVGPDLREAVKRFQARRGAPVTGLIDVHLWRRVLPSGRPLVGETDAGYIVRVLQAALVAYNGATTRVSGTWGVLTRQDVRALQQEYGLRVGNYVRAPEWALLLGPEIPRLEEARRVAKGVGVDDLGVAYEAQPEAGTTVGAGSPPPYARIGSRYSAFDIRSSLSVLGAMHDSFKTVGEAILEEERERQRQEAIAATAAGQALETNVQPDAEYHLTLPSGEKKIVKAEPKKPAPKKTPAPRKTPARAARASSARSKKSNP